MSDDKSHATRNGQRIGLGVLAIGAAIDVWLLCLLVKCVFQ